MKSYGQQKKKNEDSKQNNLLNNFTHKLRNQLEEGAEDIQDILEKLPQDEVKMIKRFLKRFIFVSETSTRESVDVKLGLKALPNKVDGFNCYRITMINFGKV